MKKMTLAAALALAVVTGHLTNPGATSAATDSNSMTTGAMSTTTDPDRAYVEGAAAASHHMVALCKKELNSGKRADIKETARKILTVEQENEAYLRDYEAKYNITHSN